MKVALVLVSVLSAALAGPPNKVQFSTEWLDFKALHGKNYFDFFEENLRFGIFTENLDRIKSHNADFLSGKQTWKMGTTKFADLTKDEFRKYLTVSVPEEHKKITKMYLQEENKEVPKNVDYREQNVVAEIKNQGSCGSCWAFATTGSVESIYALKNKKLYSLSEQNLLDCSPNECQGGFYATAYNFIKEHGIQTEESYPYKAKRETCVANEAESVVKVTGFAGVADSEEALTHAIANVGPIAACVDATDFQLYTEGVFSAKTWSEINHAVVVIGYGEENGTEYYIVRNSWGADWGEKGYVRLARNANKQLNITQYLLYPEV